jgi:hypothetical protein
LILIHLTPLLPLPAAACVLKHLPGAKKREEIYTAFENIYPTLQEFRKREAAEAAGLQALAAPPAQAGTLNGDKAAAGSGGAGSSAAAATAGSGGAAMMPPPARRLNSSMPPPAATPAPDHGHHGPPAATPAATPGNAPPATPAHVPPATPAYVPPATPAYVPPSTPGYQIPSMPVPTQYRAPAPMAPPLPRMPNKQ